MFVRHEQRLVLCRPALSDFFSLFWVDVSMSHRKDSTIKLNYMSSKIKL